MKSVEAAIIFIEELISRVYEVPETYAPTAGEADTLLHYLHFVWAEVSDKRCDFDEIRIHELEPLTRSAAIGLLTDAERTTFIESVDDPAFVRILSYWQSVDRGLGLIVRDRQ